MAATNGSTTTTHPKVPSPAKLAHIVLRTNNFACMRQFYLDFLGGRIAMENPQMAFITYDDEHHRIALVNMPDISDKVRQSSGLEHVAFTFGSLKELLAAYKGRLALKEPLRPVWCINHRVTTSLYYKDPDGNLLGKFVAPFPAGPFVLMLALQRRRSIILGTMSRRRTGSWRVRL